MRKPPEILAALGMQRGKEDQFDWIWVLIGFGSKKQESCRCFDPKEEAMNDLNGVVEQIVAETAGWA